jgi:NAD+ synthase (glutamine-hydrolysing)
MKIFVAQINPIVGDLEGNSHLIIDSIEIAQQKNADIVLFPELCLTGYPPEDFLLLPQFAKAVEENLKKIIRATKGIIAIVGIPRLNPNKGDKFLYNSAAVIQDGVLLGYQDKALLPTYDVFDERRYFEPSLTNKVWDLKGKKIGITICEDIWKHGGQLTLTDYLYDPVEELKSQKPEVVLNLSASPFYLGKFQERLSACASVAKSLKCPVILCNQIGGNDSLIFDGQSIYVGSEGALIETAMGFKEDSMLIDLSISGKSTVYNKDDVEDLHQALVLGVHDYFKKQGFTKACLGMSGGIDSAVVAYIAVEALGKENVLAVMMPSRFSSESSLSDAMGLIENLGIQSLNIPIEKPFQSYLDLLEPQFEGKAWDATEENLQARIRGMILMALSNKKGHIVLSTGNKSELAMGYATLYGDMCGGLGVISDVTKNQVYALAAWYNRSKEIIPKNIIEKPPSAELRPNQKDSDSLPEYDVIDNVLDDYVVYHKSPEEIAEKHHYSFDVVQDLIKRIHRNEYKRRQSAPGLRVSSRSFTVGRHFPIVQKWVK